MRCSPELVLTLAVLPLSAPAWAQTTWYVDASAPAPGLGTPASPYRSIQFAIDAAGTAPGDTLAIATGTYFEALDLNGKALRLVGDAAARPVLHAAGGGSVLRIDSGEGPGVELVDLVLTGGTGTAFNGGVQGGALFLEQTSATLTRCSLVDNRACNSGGAIMAFQGSVTLVDCELSRNRSNSGGAVLIQFGALQASGCVFEGNDASPLPGCATSTGQGGAVAVWAFSQATLLHCDFRDNVAPTAGGAVYMEVSAGGHRVEFCHFEANGRHQGQTIAGESGALTGIDAVVRACTFIDNHARGNGGAVSFGTYIRCTFERNSATTGGAAYSARLEDCVVRWNDALQVPGGNPSAGGGSFGCENVRTVFAGNTCARDAGGCANAFIVDRCTIVDNIGHASAAGVSGNAVTSSIVFGNRTLAPHQPVTQVSGPPVSYSLVEGVSGGVGNVSGLPLLFGQHVGDAHLLPGSPAIDAADPSLPLDPDGTRADIGALPYDPAYRAEPSRFCVAKTTSLGCVPQIASLGTPSLGAASWHVQVTGAPLGTLGLALLAAHTADTPFFGGRLCLGGPIVRAVAASAVPASGCGDALAFVIPPLGLATTGAMAGDLVFAQVWFRDALHPDGTGVGISDALVATVVP